MKKIMVLNGSPRKNGNTAVLIDRFCEGAREEGNEVKVFYLHDMNLNGCRGCFGCDKDRENPCVQRDDMKEIYDAYKEADVVVLASPLYYWHLSGQLIVALDRLLAVMRTSRDYSIDEKEAVLLMAAGGYGFELPVNYYNSLMNYLGWKNRGYICAGGVNNPKDILNSRELIEAYELGRSI